MKVLAKVVDLVEVVGVESRAFEVIVEQATMRIFNEILYLRLWCVWRNRI